MAKKLSTSSQPEKLISVSGDAIEITPDMQAELEELAAMADEDIDLTDPDAPEVTDWRGAVRGQFYRPVKKPITIRVDADVLAWFQAQEGPYQRRMNEALRDYMDRQR